LPTPKLIAVTEPLKPALLPSTALWKLAVTACALFGSLFTNISDHWPSGRRKAYDESSPPPTVLVAANTWCRASIGWHHCVLIS
jgi:hypothetical protein